MRARLLGSWGRRAARALLLLGAAAFAGAGCSSGGASSGDAGTAGVSGAAGTTGTAGASGSGAAGTTGAAGSGSAGTTGGAGAGTAGTTGAGTAGSTGVAGATAGTSGAAGATAGTSGAAGTTALVLPVARAGVYTLEFGNTKLTVDPTPGARVVEYSLDGTNILTAMTVNAKYWGSTFWTAPEGEWMALGPMYLVPGFDTLPFPTTVAGDNSFTAVGPNAMFNKKTLSVTKKFAANLAAGAIDIIYSITNQGANTFTIGHWEVTRVYPNGLTFFPAPPAASKAPVIANPTVVNPCVTKALGMIWLDHSKYVPGTPALYGKYSTDASGGWVAHVVPDAGGKGDLLLVKTFKDIADGTAGDGEVEVYYREDRSYEEVEDHHEQVMFTAGAKIDWPVRWYLRRLPVSVTRTAGNQQLVDYVTNLLK